MAAIARTRAAVVVKERRFLGRSDLEVRIDGRVRSVDGRLEALFEIQRSAFEQANPLHERSPAVAGAAIGKEDVEFAGASRQILTHIEFVFLQVAERMVILAIV